MSLLQIVPVALRLADEQTSITDELGSNPGQRISFARAPQGLAKPYITLNIQGADYEATTTSSEASGVYRIDYIIYADTAQKALTILDALKTVAAAYTNVNYDVRLLDEDYFVDVDGVHRATLATTWRTGV